MVSDKCYVYTEFEGKTWIVIHEIWSILVPRRRALDFVE